WIHDLRVFIAPPRLGDFALSRGHSLESALVFIEDEAVGAVADSMGLHLNTLLERRDQHGSEWLGFYGEKTGGIGFIGVGRKHGGSARSQRAIRYHLNRAHGEMVVKEADLRPFAQQAFGLWTRTVDRLVDAHLQLTLLVELAI